LLAAKGKKKVKPAGREERKIAGEPFLGAVLTEREGRLAEGENGGLFMRGRGRLAEDDGVLPVIAAVEAGVGSKGRNLQKLGENAGFLADFGPDSLLLQVFKRDSIYRRCNRAILSILGKIFSP
jgi:hypothetical protein